MSRLPRALLVLTLSLGTVVATADCAVLTKLLTVTPTQVQLTQAIADTVDAATTLGEAIIQVAATSHKLHQAGVWPLAVDNAVQTAGLQYAQLQTKAVADINKATSFLELTASAAPLIGQATTITTTLKNAPTTGFTGTAALLASQVPGLLTNVQKAIATLTGGK